MLDIPATSRAKVVDDDDFVPALEEEFGEVRADKTATAGDQTAPEVDPKLNICGKIAG